MSAALPLANSPASSPDTLSGVSARSFQRWMIPDSTRAGHFLSSMPSACSSCLISRVWSSVSRMVKLLFSPTSSAWRRSTRTPMAWKVPSHIPSAAPPIRLATRSSISRAALLVKVTARICDGRARPVIKRLAIRVVSTRVLPVPAPASTSNGPPWWITASRCSSFSPSRWAVDVTARRAGWGSVGTGSSVISNGSAGDAMQRHIAIGAADAYP